MPLPLSTTLLTGALLAAIYNKEIVSACFLGLAILNELLRTISTANLKVITSGTTPNLIEKPAKQDMVVNPDGTKTITDPFALKEATVADPYNLQNREDDE